MKLSLDKKQVLHDLISWYRNNYKKPAYITVGGYAGTGKTTLAALLRKVIYKKNTDLKIAFVSYTGKAARVMKQYLKSVKAVLPKDFAGTIHSLIYSPIVNKQGVIVGWDKQDKIDYDLIMIDEASMVDYDIWDDLQSYQIPIIAFGDHGQLPPIKGSFSLMSSPDLTLETIHRQAQNNPIIEISIMARKQGHIPVQKFSPKVMKLSQQDFETQEKMNELIQHYDEDALILCGYNWTRVELNQSVRKALGFFDPQPQPEDRVICLRNNHQKGIYNGMLGTIKTINREDPDWYFAKIKMDGDDDLFEGLIAVDQFNSKKGLNFGDKRKQTLKGDLFDFGYVLTVHKAQGSQAKRVILLEQRFKQMSDQEWRRWLYTAVTRAEEELYIIGD